MAGGEKKGKIISKILDLYDKNIKEIINKRLCIEIAKLIYILKYQDNQH